MLVSHAFKKQRFLDLHCATIQWPLNRIEYIGIDPSVEGDEKKRKQIEEGEEKARQEWRKDWWGWAREYGLRSKR